MMEIKKKNIYRNKERKREKSLSKKVVQKTKNTLSKWKYQGCRTKNTTVKNGPVKQYDMIVEKYGKPDILINKEGGFVYS